jgi:hypothetical protein
MARLLQNIWVEALDRLHSHLMLSGDEERRVWKKINKRAITAK